MESKITDRTTTVESDYQYSKCLFLYGSLSQMCVSYSPGPPIRPRYNTNRLFQQLGKKTFLLFFSGVLVWFSWGSAETLTCNLHTHGGAYSEASLRLAHDSTGKFLSAKRWGTLFLPLLVGPSTVRHLAKTKKDGKGSASSSLWCLCVLGFSFFPKGEREILGNWTRGGLGAAVLAQHRAPQCYDCIESSSISCSVYHF